MFILVTVELLNWKVCYFFIRVVFFKIRFHYSIKIWKHISSKSFKTNYSYIFYIYNLHFSFPLFYFTFQCLIIITINTTIFNETEIEYVCLKTFFKNKTIWDTFFLIWNKLDNLLLTWFFLKLWKKHTFHTLFTYFNNSFRIWLLLNCLFNVLYFITLLKSNVIPQDIFIFLLYCWIIKQEILLGFNMSHWPISYIRIFV